VSLRRDQLGLEKAPDHVRRARIYEAAAEVAGKRRDDQRFVTCMAKAEIAWLAAMISVGVGVTIDEELVAVFAEMRA
jgi:hypothetical protein